jgi:hypothetical protein
MLQAIEKILTCHHSTKHGCSDTHRQKRLSHRDDNPALVLLLNPNLTLNPNRFVSGIDCAKTCGLETDEE